MIQLIMFGLGCVVVALIWGNSSKETKQKLLDYTDFSED